MQSHALLALYCTGDLSVAYAELLGQVKPHLLPDLPRQLNCVLADCGGTPPLIACCV